MIKETIIAYVLLCDSSFHDMAGSLTDKVNSYIDKGYEPFMSPQPWGGNGEICQAVVKYKE